MIIFLSITYDSYFYFTIITVFSFNVLTKNPRKTCPHYSSAYAPVKGGISVVEKDAGELLAVGPLKMLRHSWTVRSPPSVTVLPLPHDHRVPVLLPLGAHPLSTTTTTALGISHSHPSTQPHCGISHARATHTRAAGAWEHFRVFPRSSSS